MAGAAAAIAADAGHGDGLVGIRAKVETTLNRVGAPGEAAYARGRQLDPELRVPRILELTSPS